MASLFDMGQIERLVIFKKGMRGIQRSNNMQVVLVNVAMGIAKGLNAGRDGGYSYGPIGEPVTSQVGAHSFVRAGNKIAMQEQKESYSLNNALLLRRSLWT